jgi:pimeloyl-ACP methyl ester carboxylesterase
MMHCRIFYALLFCFSIMPVLVWAQPGKPGNKKQVYVIVHGAWGGSWAFKKVDSLLTEKQAVVYRPSLTGLGERVHLANTNVGLNTHIQDVVNMILFEDLHDIVLVGHSYGGMVITGVADSVAKRISSLIYVDAFVPNHDESLLSIAGNRSQSLRATAVNGFIVPAWVKANQQPPKDVPHPLKTLTDTLILKSKSAAALKTTYILTVAAGADAKSDDFASQAERAAKRGWKVLTLTADHNPQWSQPEKLVQLLYDNR